MKQYNRSRRHRIVRSIGKFFGYIVAPVDSLDEYGNVFWCREEEADIEEYEAIQKKASERKYGLSWAKQETCNEILSILGGIDNPAQSILCHGVRRGEELRYLSHAGIKEIVGTDLYVPSNADSRIVQCNMNEPQQVFDSRFDVIYSNSLDHAQNPVKTLLLWAVQLNNKPSSRIVLEMDAGHSACGSSDLDVSGIDLQRFPFYLSVESNGALFCDKIAKSNSCVNRYFYFISRGSKFIEQ